MTSPPRSCAIAAGRDASNNTVICNFGLTPEQLKQVTEAAVSGATAPLLDRIAAVSKTLGVTEEAAKTLLRIVGEQPDVPNGAAGRGADEGRQRLQAAASPSGRAQLLRTPRREI